LHDVASLIERLFNRTKSETDSLAGFVSGDIAKNKTIRPRSVAADPETLDVYKRCSPSQKQAVLR